MRGWMRAKGWEVTATDYHFDQGIYSWRHQQPGGKPPTLRVARQVLEHNPLEGPPERRYPVNPDLTPGQRQAWKRLTAARGTTPGGGQLSAQ